MKYVALLLALIVVACQSAPGIGVAPTEDSARPMEVIETPVVTLAPLESLPTGPISMVAIGDSLTEGDTDETGLGYTGRVLDAVIQRHPDSTMVNLGKSGWNSDALINGDQGLDGQLPRAVNEVQAAVSNGRSAVVFVWIGSNDLWYLYEYGGDVTDEQEQQDLEHFSSNMDVILSQLRGAGAQVLVALLDDQAKRPIALRGEAFLEITPGELARMSLQAQRYNNAIIERAALHGALPVDFYNTDIFTNADLLYYDGNHPNTAGYERIAEIWLDSLETLLP
ncbi:MAG: GDSL-type esterase/lipase family protein [Anaerolineales bacterium]|nr:GDSL-type esterase/lipase family protein [Anaerolineales bacterium]